MYLCIAIVMYELKVHYVYSVFALLIYGFSMVNYVFSRTYEECSRNFIWDGFYQKDECVIQDLDATNAQIISLLSLFLPWQSTWSMKLIQGVMTAYNVYIYDGGDELWKHSSIHVISSLCWLLNAFIYKHSFMKA